MEFLEFAHSSLCDQLKEALQFRGFERATAVQTAVLGRDDMKKDLVARARTGSGKTLGFLLPLLHEFTVIPESQGVRYLVLSPTRELALQIAQEAEFFGRKVGCAVATLVGGMDYEPQIRSLRRGASLVVGTPGRILDHLKKGSLKLDNLDTVVLDEGDTMLDMGFREELEAILEAASQRSRTWLFSATVPPSIQSLIDRYLKDPEVLSLDSERQQHDDITHRVYLVPTSGKYQGLVNVLLWEHPSLCLIFCRTRNDTAELTERLQNEGFMALPLHGDMSQRERNSALTAFRSGRVPILVATNVAARGLDINGVSHVLQLGVPESMETFVHRSGRTGRAGNEGVNLLILTPSESRRFKFMLRNSNMTIQWLKVPDPKDIDVIQRQMKEQELLSSEPDDQTRAWAKKLLNDCDDPLGLLAKLLYKAVGESKIGYGLTETLQEELDRRSLRRGAKPFPFERERDSKGDRRRYQTIGGVALRINKGRRDDDWSVGRILGALCGTLGVDRSEIGNIRMRETHTEVELSPKAVAMMEKGGRGRLEEKGLIGDKGARKLDSLPIRPGGQKRLRRFDEKGRRLDSSTLRRSARDGKSKGFKTNTKKVRG